MKQRTFLLLGLLVCLVVAGLGSYYASSHPDGLEFVAETTGFREQAKDSAVSDSPLADYQVKGIENPRLSGGLAGVVGVLLIAGLSTALFWLLRRRSHEDESSVSRS